MPKTLVPQRAYHNPLPQPLPRTGFRLPRTKKCKDYQVCSPRFGPFTTKGYFPSCAFSSVHNKGIRIACSCQWVAGGSRASHGVRPEAAPSSVRDGAMLAPVGEGVGSSSSSTPWRPAAAPVTDDAPVGSVIPADPDPVAHVPQQTQASCTAHGDLLQQHARDTEPPNVRPLRTPADPTLREWEEHEICHYPYRA